MSNKMNMILNRQDARKSASGGFPSLAFLASWRLISFWEHAYYLQCKNNKAAFFEAVWNLWNWENISDRFEHARALQLGMTG